MTLLEAARQALKELEGLNESPHLQDCFHAFDGEIAALRQAIDQAQQCVMENAQGDLERISLVQTGVGIGKPEQEPVAWITAGQHTAPLRTHWEGCEAVHPECKKVEQVEQQEPVAWYCKEGLKRGVSLKQEGPEWIPLYTKELP